MNIYQILESLQRVEEGAMKRLDDMFNDWMDSEDRPYNDMAGDDRAVMGCAYRYLDGKVDPSKMEDYAMALTHAYHGGIDEAFTGYWKGSDKRTPGTKMVGGTDESVEMECNNGMSPLEKKLRARWETTKAGLQEYGMTTGGTANPAANSTTDPAAQAKEKVQAQQKVNTLKSAGVPFTSVSQAVNTITKDPSEPTTAQDRQVAGGLGQEVEQLLSKGDPGTVNQLAALIRKNKQAGAA